MGIHDCELRVLPHFRQLEGDEGIRLFRLAGWPALARVLMIPNFLHMMEATLIIGTFCTLIPQVNQYNCFLQKGFPSYQSL